MKKLRVLTLIRKGLEPPVSTDGLSEEEFRTAPWKTEYDVVQSLESLGHEIMMVGVHDDLRVIQEAIEEWKPHIAFNLLEEFAGEALFDQNVVTYLELHRIPYTGCNPRGLMISRDKALSKKLLAYHRIRTPNFQVFPYGRRFGKPARLRFPLIVKSVVEDASFGISQASLVKDEESLKNRIAFVHEQTGFGAIAEEFIEGRELYVGILGNKRLDVFPVWELVFEKKPEDAPLIATARAKWNLKYQKKWGVSSRAAKHLPERVRDEIARRCRRIYRNLYMNGYARLDFRLDGDNKLYCLEANPNPDLSYGEDFAESAEKKGISYDRLIQRILNLGLQWESE